MQKIGLFTCITIITGSMVGSAIFSLSGLTMYQAGPASILSWVIAAAIMLIYGLISAELAAIYPKSGGVYVFPAKALGPVWGWISAWGFIIANIVAISFSAIYFATYLNAGFGLSPSLQIPIAIVSIILVLILNCINFSTTGNLNSILVSAMVVCILVYCFAGVFSGLWDPSQFTPFFTQGADGTAGFIHAIPTAMIGYGAIVSVSFMVSEVRNPEKNVPLAVIISMVIVAAMYVFIIVATQGLISTSYLAAHPDMRYIPLYAVCFLKLSRLFPWMPKVISLAAVFALFTTMLVVLALTARAIQAASEDGILPKFLGKTNKNQVPAIATVIISVISGIISCFPSFIEFILGLGALFSAVTIAITIISLYAARKKEKTAKTGIRIYGTKLLPAIALVLIVGSYIPDIIRGSWQIWVFSAASYAIGFIIYAVNRKKTGIQK